MTRAPPCAMSVAIAAATVDLPSLGRHDVKPMTLVFVTSPFMSTVSFNARMASAYGDDGESMIVCITFGPELMLLSVVLLASAMAGCERRRATDCRRENILFRLSVT